MNYLFKRDTGLITLSGDKDGILGLSQYIYIRRDPNGEVLVIPSVLALITTLADITGRWLIQSIKVPGETDYQKKVLFVPPSDQQLSGNGGQSCTSPLVQRNIGWLVYQKSLNIKDRET